MESVKPERIYISNKEIQLPIFDHQVTRPLDLNIKIDWAIFCLSRQLAELDLYVILYFLAKRNNNPLPLSLCCVAVCWMCYNMQL